MTKAKPKINVAKVNTADWRNLPLDRWNVRTFSQMFIDLNHEYYGMEYVPMRNWRFEQGVIKRELNKYGAATLKAAFDECFRTYKPTAAYPILTAGFAVAYRINTIIPRLLAEQADADRRQSEIEAAESAPLPEVIW